MAGLTSVSRWSQRGAWTLMDQGLTAAANFILSVTLARWMTEVQYGTWAIAYSTLLLIGTAHSALVTEPFLVFAQGRFSGRARSYVFFGLRAHGAVSVAALLVLGLTAGLLVVAGHAEWSIIALTVAATAPFFLLAWYARRAAIAFLRPGRAALGSGAYLLLIVVGLLVLRNADRVELVTAFVLIGVAGALAAVVTLLGLSGALVEAADVEAAPEISPARLHWKYGRWALATAGLAWLPGNIYFFVLPFSVGLGGSAAFRALLNLTTPVMHALHALSTLTIPALAERHRTTGSYRLPGKLLVGLFLVPAAYGIVLALFGSHALSWLYGDRYTEYANVLWIFAVLPVLAAALALLAAELCARERPDLVFRAYVVGALVTATVGIALVFAFGVAGAAAGWCASYAALVVAHRRLLARNQGR